MSKAQRKGPLTKRERGFLYLATVALIAAVVLYALTPPNVTTTTIERGGDETSPVTKTTTVDEEQLADPLLLGGLGAALVLFLTALLNGRIKFTAPGGAGAEVTEVAADIGKEAAEALQAEIQRRDDEIEKLKRELEAAGRPVELAPLQLSPRATAAVNLVRTLAEAFEEPRRLPEDETRDKNQSGDQEETQAR